jgi:hypothetical protein
VVAVLHYVRCSVSPVSPPMSSQQMLSRKVEEWTLIRCSPTASHRGTLITAVITVAYQEHVRTTGVGFALGWNGSEPSSPSSPSMHPELFESLTAVAVPFYHSVEDSTSVRSLVHRRNTHRAKTLTRGLRMGLSSMINTDSGLGNSACRCTLLTLAISLEATPPKATLVRRHRSGSLPSACRGQRSLL